MTLPGLADLSVIIIEQVKKNYTVYRKEREEYIIQGHEQKSLDNREAVGRI